MPEDTNNRRIGQSETTITRSGERVGDRGMADRWPLQDSLADRECEGNECRPDDGEPSWIRTSDLLIKSQLLYQLSYGPDLRLDLCAGRGAVNRASSWRTVAPVSGSRQAGAISASSPSTKARERKAGWGTIGPAPPQGPSDQRMMSRSSTRGPQRRPARRPKRRSIAFSSASSASEAKRWPPSPPPLRKLRRPGRTAGGRRSPHP